MAYVEKKPDPKTGRYRAGFIDWRGKKARFTGSTNAKETLRRAQRLEDEDRDRRLSRVEGPKSWDLAKARLFAEAKEEYLSWGTSQGGIRGRAWSARQPEKRRFFLDFWQARLGLATLGDLKGILSRVEDVLRDLQGNGRTDLAGKTRLINGRKQRYAAPKPLAGKTLTHYADGLRAFCLWLAQRGQLAEDPLKGLAPFDHTPKTQRRAPTAEEVHRFFAKLDEKGTVYAKRRRLGYELALSSGLRAEELRALKVKHLDTGNGGLHLDAALTKNRKPGFQPLPRFLADRLAAASAGKGPEEPLVFVGADAAEALQKDLKRAGIPITAPGAEQWKRDCCNRRRAVQG